MSEPGPPRPSSADFRRLMGRWATGVSVVTAHHDGVDAGLTVNALLSVALAPPSLLVSLTHDVDTLPVLERARSFAANFLAADQRALSERFARPTPSPEKFLGLPFHRGRLGPALLGGTLGAAECRVVSLQPLYDHVLVVGEVVALETGRDAPPLLFFHGQYAEEDGGDRLRLPPPRTGDAPHRPP